MGYKYCPYCKEDIKFENYSYVCKNNHIVYINPAPCVSIIPVKNNQILLCKRGIEPRKGTYDFIGGFVNVGETIENAVLRETKEETGLVVKLEKYLGEYSEEYTPQVSYPLCFTYIVSIVNGDAKANDDVSELIWINIKDIENLDLTGSFPTIERTLEDLAKIYS